MLLHTIPRVFLNKFNGLSRNFVTDITLAKCHGHYIIMFLATQWLQHTKIASFLLESSVNELWMSVSEHNESIGCSKLLSNACIEHSRTDTSKLGVHFFTDCTAEEQYIHVLVFNWYQVLNHKSVGLQSAQGNIICIPVSKTKLNFSL